jgi:hypothetical protein
LDPKRLVFVTLTRKVRPGSSPVSLRHRVAETREAFRQLIRQKRFKLLQGGFSTMEVKWSTKVQGWNVHIHAVCELAEGSWRRIWQDNKGKGKNKGRFKADVIGRKGKTLTIQSLRKSWKRLTKDSDRVDITPVLEKFGGVNGVMSYILKYLNKPAEVGERGVEYNIGLKGSRLVYSFGTWYPTAKKYRFADVPKPKKYLMRCDNCSSTFWTTEYWIDGLIRSYQKEREKGQHGKEYVAVKVRKRGSPVDAGYDYIGRLF